MTGRKFADELLVGIAVAFLANHLRKRVVELGRVYGGFDQPSTLC